MFLDSPSGTLPPHLQPMPSSLEALDQRQLAHAPRVFGVVLCFTITKSSASDQLLTPRCASADPWVPLTPPSLIPLVSNDYDYGLILILPCSIQALFDSLVYVALSLLLSK